MLLHRTIGITCKSLSKLFRRLCCANEVWKDAWQWLCEGRSLEISANVNAAQLHSSERAASLAWTPHCCLCERIIDGEDGVMNRQRDAEGENANHRQDEEEGVEAEAGSLGRRKRESQGRRHVAKTSLIPLASLHPLVFYLRRGEPWGCVPKWKDGFEIAHSKRENPAPLLWMSNQSTDGICSPLKDSPVCLYWLRKRVLLLAEPWQLCLHVP